MPAEPPDDPSLPILPRRRRGRRAGSLDTLTNALRAVYPGKTRFDEARVFGAWNDCVPARVARNAQPVRLSRGVLTVHVKTTVWAQELTFLREDIVHRIAARTSPTLVRDLRFRVGPMPDVARIPHLERPVPQPPPRPAPLAPELERALADVDDPALRAVIREAAATGLGRLEEEEAARAAGREAAALRARAEALEAMAKRRKRRP